jgi:hypothetical protein
MAEMSYNPAAKRRALSEFIRSNHLSEYRLEKAARIGQGTIGKFVKGVTLSMTDESWVKLAAGAMELLGRRVTVEELMGEMIGPVPITSRIGAGEQVHPVQMDLPLGYVSPPPGVMTTEAWQVDGDSMRPLYGPRDLLFPGRHRREPSQLVGRIVAAQVANDGPRCVKLLMRGSRKDRWNLQSVNPAHRTMEDMQLEWVALIAAAIYAEA